MKTFSAVSSWRNRVRPVTVDPSPAAADSPGRRRTTRTPDHPRGSDHSSQSKTKAHRRSLSGRVERKTAPRTRNLSLKQALGLISKSPAEKVTKTPKAKPATRNSSPNTSRNLNVSLRSCAPRLLCLQQQTENISETETAQVSGALGLSLVTEMFKAQSISTQRMKETETTVASKKGRKNILKRTPSRLGMKRKSLGQNKAEVQRTGVENSDSMSRFVDHPKRASSSLNATVCVSSSAGGFGVQTAKKSPNLPLRKVFSVLHKEPMSREWSTGTLKLKELDLSLETSIMNRLYPANDSSLSLTDSMVSTDSLSATQGNDDKTPKRPSGSSAGSLRRSLRNIINTTASPAQNDTKPATPCTKSAQAGHSPTSILDNSYSRAQDDAFVIGTPVRPKVQSSGRENRGMERSKRASTRSLPAKTGAVSRSAETPGGPDPSGWRPSRPVGRSRSLRVWGAGGGVEVTGKAGSTPRPRRRRRHPSYEERLIS